MPGTTKESAMTRKTFSLLLVAGSLLTGVAPAFAQHDLEHPEAISPPFHFANQRDRNRQELIAQLIAGGKEIPPSLLPQPSAQGEFRRGTLLAGLGTGLGAVLYIVSDDWRVAAWALVPLCLAAASFVNAAMFGRQPGARQ
jgi:hypothetical protein